MILFGVVPEPFHRSPISIVAALVPLEQVAKGKPSFTDEASKYTGAPSESKPEGHIVLTQAAVRHQKSSLVISAQGKTRSDVKGQENPGHRSVRFGKSYCWTPTRQQQNASSSSGRNETQNPNAQASGPIAVHVDRRG